MSCFASWSVRWKPIDNAEYDFGMLTTCLRFFCEEAARGIDRVLPDPAPKCLFIDFGDSSLKLQLRFWIADAQNGVQNVKSAVLLRIWEMFREQNIEIPYPQRDLHLRSSSIEFSPIQGSA